MQPKVLYILSSYNLYGGTPKKTMDLMNHFGKQSVLYVYLNAFAEFKCEFEKTGGSIYEGFYGRNIIKHIKKLLFIIDTERIEIVQTQFSMGETLGYFIKKRRPHIKTLITFESALQPSSLKSIVITHFYQNFDSFLYISNYVKTEKIKQFPLLERKKNKVVYNGINGRIDDGSKTSKFRDLSLLCVGSLIQLKNVQILIEAMNIIVHQKQKLRVNLYVVGEGLYETTLKKLVEKYNLETSIHFLGNQTNVGNLLKQTDIFVHPSYNEGFGLSVVEAMHAEKPIIVSKAGALPELIENNKSGLIVDPHCAEEWAEAIIKLIKDSQFAKNIAQNAKKRAENNFSLANYTRNYEQFYHSL